MAVFTVLNGTGINGAGVQFGSIASTIAPSGIAGNPSMSGTSGFVNFVGGGQLKVTGTGLSFNPPFNLAGTVDSMTYEKSAVDIFSVTGMSMPVATLATLFFGGDENTVLGAIFAGADQISGSTMADTLEGYDSNDTVNGGDGLDNLDGGNGNDLLIGGTGGDTINGGAGVDAAVYSTSLLAVVANLGLGLGLAGDALGDTFTSIENLGGSTLADALTGDAGANALNGGGGNDLLVGADGNDALYGGNGDDIGSGGAGADSASGGAGADTISGEDGNDALNGGADADSIDGGAGIDTADYNGSGVGVTVNLETNVNTGGYAEGDSLSNIENVQGSGFDDNLTGNAVNNSLSGLAGNDVLNGGAGWDTLDGGAGDDVLNGGSEGDILRGGAGADQLNGGDGTDTASYFQSAEGVTINLDTNVNTGGAAEGDTIADDVEIINGSTHDDAMTGDALSNELSGFDGNDVLDGAGGNDSVRGGVGADTLTGGAGGDYFSFTSAFDSTVSSTDTIQDYQKGVDLISLRLIDADANSGNGDTAFIFLGTGAFTGAAGQLRYESAEGMTVVQADVNGDSTADIVINLTGTDTLAASNFLL